jgi:hypothetical protein
MSDIYENKFWQFRPKNESEVEYTTRKLKIDPEFEAIADPVAPIQDAVLERTLRRRGFLEWYYPVYVWKDTIVDGHRRYKICQRLGIPFAIKQVEFEDRMEAKIFIIRQLLESSKTSSLFNFYSRMEDMAELDPQGTKELYEMAKKYQTPSGTDDYEVDE